MAKHGNEMRELTINELDAVSGAFFGALLTYAGFAPIGDAYDKLDHQVFGPHGGSPAKPVPYK